MVKNYVLGIGHVGIRLVANAVQISGGTYRIERTLGGELRYVDRAVEDVEFQLIDMGIDDEKTAAVLETLVRDHGFVPSDQIYAIKLNEGDYKEESISLSAKIEGFTCLTRYYETFVRPLLRYLGPGRGVQRYRPLAKHFITRREAFQMLMRYFNSDIDEDIVNEGHGNERIKLVAVLSSGGGFGSGSLHYVLTLLTTLLSNRNIDYTVKAVVNIPTGNIGYTPDPKDQAPVDGLEGTKASSAALLLELLYLHKLRPGLKAYKDDLLTRAFMDAGLNPEKSHLSGVDEIILTTFTNITGKDISSIYDLHDEEIGRFLYSELRAELGTIRENVYRLYGEYMNYIASRTELGNMAKELLIPVTVVGVASIQIDPRKIYSLLKEIEVITKDLGSKREYLKDLHNVVGELRLKISELQNRLNNLTQELSEIQLDNLKNDADLNKKLDDMKRALELFVQSIVSELGARIDYLTSVREFAKVENEIENLTQLYVSLSNSKELLHIYDEVANSVNKCRMLLRRGQLDRQEIVELGKHQILLENALGALKRITELVSNFNVKVDEYRKKLEPGVLDKIVNRHKCRAYERLTNLYNLVGRDINNIEQKITLNTRELETIRSYHIAQVDKVKAELENTERSISALKKDLEVREETIRSVNREIIELEDKLGRRYEEISKELLRDLQKYYGNVLREVDLENFIKELKDTIKSLDKGGIGISTIVNVIRKINPTLADRVIEAITNNMRRLSYFATLTPELNKHLAQILGIDSDIVSRCLVELKYVVTSPDNYDLAQELRRRIGGEVDIIKVEKAKMSFITYIKRRVVAPIQIKEVRDCLRAFFKATPRAIVKADKTDIVEEYRGKAYLTLNIDDPGLTEYLERVKKTLEDFENRLKNLTGSGES